MKKVAIIGGGISGLLSAFFLSKKEYEVTIFEKARTGGKIQTAISPHGLMETAANAILADSLVEEVCKEIGIELIPTLKESKARYIFKDGKPRRWPLGIADTLKLVKFYFKKPWRDEASMRERTLRAWLADHLPMRVVDLVFTPACQGIFGVGADQLSASLIMNYFFNKKKTAKGRLRGSVSAKRGMGEIISALETYLRSQGVRFETQDVSSLTDLVAVFSEVVVATDIKSAASLLESIRDFRGSVLKNIPCVDLVSINAFFSGHSPYPGFGILFPSGSDVDALGVLQNTFIFPQRSSAGVLSETWIYRTKETSDPALIGAMIADRKRVLDDAALSEAHVNHWPQALPLYGVELEKVLENMPPGHPRVHLMGNYLGEIGLNRLFRRASQLLE